MTDSSPWARIVDVSTSEGKATLTLDFAGERITTPEISGEAANALGKAMLALAIFDARANVQIPALGVFRISNLEDAGSILLSYFPGDIATKGLAGLLP